MIGNIQEFPLGRAFRERRPFHSNCDTIGENEKQNWVVEPLWRGEFAADDAETVPGGKEEERVALAVVHPRGRPATETVRTHGQRLN